ncbi:hypothetical protein Bca52824_044580 [Brassica carinata]|uniref:F-box associated beta-propeller type 3 domain-containing protein n=1 Tax=Brassica carinata TaxID=52824 RepID=A0A8X7UQQ8_BRACI|nr:hypothetical protein Bca52824_044580 [Brassica carinata]
MMNCDVSVGFEIIHGICEQQLRDQQLVQCCIPHWPTPKSICIGGVLYYKTVSGTADSYSMVVCFDLRTEKFSCVKFSGISSKAKPASQTLVNYNGKLVDWLERLLVIDVLADKANGPRGVF